MIKFFDISDNESLECQQCGRVVKVNKNFFSNKDKKKGNICKKCLTKHVDAYDPSTFTWILKDFDFPYVPGE